jgi:hypothetical protein
MAQIQAVEALPMEWFGKVKPSADYNAVTQSRNAPSRRMTKLHVRKHHALADNEEWEAGLKQD